MSFTWTLNSGHDLSIQNGSLSTVRAEDEIKQRILVSLLHYWQEYFLNVQSGVPWYESILGSKDLKTVEIILRKEILDVPGVLGILAFEMVRGENRHFDVYATVEVEAGPGITYATLMISATPDESTSNEFAYINVQFAGTNWMFGD